MKQGTKTIEKNSQGNSYLIVSQVCEKLQPLLLFVYNVLKQGFSYSIAQVGLGHIV